ncbi:MAG: nucleotidyltransferase domain-containing protein [Bacteroidetes bacterium]|nr:nucleotidyltransferase domain-containing protein [Bacteroidota bacterium]
MNQTAANIVSEEIRQSVLKALAYFDLFNYPLMESEILFFSDCQLAKELVRNYLRVLVNEGLIFHTNGFYSLHNKPELSEQRVIHNENAAQLLPLARRISNFLYQFPYVRGIGISGSLSKNVATENSDIDYFIITKANRLWIARTVMHLYKKLSFLVGREHLYCMNYFIDETAMEIEEKNIFTAMELITLLPTCGNGTMDKFAAANEWAVGFYPNSGRKEKAMTLSHHSFIKRFIEKMFNNRTGDKIDNYFMQLTFKRWMKKEELGKKNSRGERMGLKLDKHFCKPNPEYFQGKILSMYRDKLNELYISRQ